MQKRTLPDCRGDVPGHVIIEKRVQLLLVRPVVGGGGGGGGRSVRGRRRSLRVRHQFACGKYTRISERLCEKSKGFSKKKKNNYNKDFTGRISLRKKKYPLFPKQSKIAPETNIFFFLLDLFRFSSIRTIPNGIGTVRVKHSKS